MTPLICFKKLDKLRCHLLRQRKLGRRDYRGVIRNLNLKLEIAVKIQSVYWRLECTSMEYRTRSIHLKGIHFRWCQKHGVRGDLLEQIWQIFNKRSEGTYFRVSSHMRSWLLLMLLLFPLLLFLFILLSSYPCSSLLLFYFVPLKVLRIFLVQEPFIACSHSLLTPFLKSGSL